MTAPSGSVPEPAEREAMTRHNLLPALLALSDVLDEDEGPVILAWGVGQLTAALAKALDSYGLAIMPFRPADVSPTSSEVPRV